MAAIPKSWQKFIPWVVLGALVLGLLALYGWERERRGRAEFEVEIKADSLRDQLKRAEAAEKAASAARDSAAEAQRALQAQRERTAALRASAARRGAEAEERAAEAGESLRETLEANLPELVLDTALAQLAELEEQHEQQRSAWQEQMAAAAELQASTDSALARVSEALQAERRLNAELRESLRLSQEEAELWKRQANPDFFSGLLDDLPQLLGAAGAGALLGVALTSGG